MFYPAELELGPFSIEYPDRIIPLIIGFVLLVLLLWRVNLPYVSIPYFRDLLKDRGSRIEADKISVDRALADVQQLRNDYATRLRKIEEEARERIDAAVREAEAARSEIIAEAQVTAQALRRRSEEEMARESTRQRILFRQQVVQTTLDAAERAVRANLGDSVQRRLIDDFITQAAGQSANGAAAPSAAGTTSTQGGA